MQVYWTRIKAKEEDPDPPPHAVLQLFIYFVSFLGGAVIVGTLARTHHATNFPS